MTGVIPLCEVTERDAARRVLIACPLRTADEPHIRDAMRGRAEVRFVSRVDELPRVVAEEGGAAMGVLVAASADGVRIARQLVKDYPDVPVVGHCRAGAEHSETLRSLVLSGAHAYLFAGIDDYGIALRAVFESAARECAGERVLDALVPLVPPRLHPLVETCLLHPQSATSVAGVADMLSVTRKTLFNACRREGFPPPAELMTWCRLMLAVHLLERTTRTVLSVALELEFASDTSLRNLLKRYVGKRATDARRGGGLQAVIARFQQRCETLHAAHAP